MRTGFWRENLKGSVSLEDTNGTARQATHVYRNTKVRSVTAVAMEKH
jgi:hypothetical protein